jgi:capsular exopolysaccharide synthesis family protein
MSRFAESFRSARAYLQISGDQGPRIIQVTSAVPGEGKSTVAAALAVSAAAAGVRTVLVDVDVRFSAISSMFGIEGERGLADILWDDASIESVLQTNYQPGLAVLGAGSTRRPQPDMVLSDRLKALVRELSETFTLVILDCPPVLAVSDALVVSRCAAETLLVVKWRSTAKDVIGEAIKALWTVDAPLVGVIFNKVDLSKMNVHGGAYRKYSQAIYKYFRT